MNFAKDAWIRDKYTGWVGYICMVNEDLQEASVRFIRTDQGMRLRTVGIRDLERLELMPVDIRQEDLIALQHLAVDMNDKNWFVLLGERICGMVP